MPRTVLYNGVTQQFPDDATDDEIRSALEASDKPKDKTLGGFVSNVGSSGVRFIENLAQGASDLAGKGVEAVLDPRQAVKDLRESHPLDAIARIKDYYKHRYGFDKPTLKEGVQQALDTAYEDPVGVAADVSTVASGVGGAAKLANIAKVPMAGAVARGATAVADATNPLNVTKLPWVAARTITPVDDALNAAGTKLYESSLKVPPSVDRAKRVPMIEAGLKNKIPVSGAGLKKARRVINDIEGQVSGAVADAANNGATVPSGPVADRVDDIRPRFNTVNPVADQQALSSAQHEFLSNQPANIPIQDAQDIKRNTYRKLDDAAYGEQSTAQIEAQKALARGLKEEIYNLLPPEIQALGSKEKVLIDLEDVLKRFTNREGNKQIVGIEGPIAGHLSPTLGAIVQFFDRNPALKSRVAIAMANRGSAPGPIIRTTNQIKRLGPPVSTYGASPAQQ